MDDTNSSQLSLIGTPFMAASFPLSAMRDADYSLVGLIFTSFLDAWLDLCAMSLANSSILGLLGTFLLATKFHYRASVTNSFSLGLVVTFIKAPSLPLSAMHDTYSYLPLALLVHPSALHSFTTAP